MNTSKILVIDLETTGLDECRNGVIEIGACWLSGDTDQHFYERCRPMPDREIDYHALRISETWPHELEGRPWEVTAYGHLLQFIGQERGIIMAGMNVGKFDFKFLEDLADRSGLPFPFSHRTLDMHSLAVPLAIQLGQDITRLTTDTIYQMLEMLPELRPHRANTGALMERQAIRKLLGLEAA